MRPQLETYTRQTEVYSEEEKKLLRLVLKLNNVDGKEQKENLKLI